MFNDVCDPQRSNLLRRVAVDGGIRRIIITNSYIDESIRLDATLFCTSAVIKNLRANKEHESIPTITTINDVELGRIQMLMILIPLFLTTKHIAEWSIIWLD